MIEAQFQAFNERLVIFRNPSRSWGTISSRWCAPTRIDRNGTRSITVSLLPVSFANPCIRLTFYKSTVDNEQFTYQRRSFDPDLQVVPCFDWPWSIFIDETTRFATRTRRRGRESPVVSMMITQACLVLVKRWRLHGPNRSTGLGQLTAGQSRGTRRHAALTADPREPIASTRLSTLSLTRDSQPLPPCAPYDLPRLTGTSWELDESRPPPPPLAPLLIRVIVESNGQGSFVDIGTEISENIGIALRSSGNISSDFFRFHLIDWLKGQVVDG